MLLCFSAAPALGYAPPGAHGRYQWTNGRYEPTGEFFNVDGLVRDNVASP